MTKIKSDYYSDRRRAELQKKRALRKEQIRLGTESNRRLWFVKAILKNKGVKQQEVARALGMTPQNFNYIINLQDDCYLSVLEDILHVVGVSCRVSFDSGKSETETKEKSNPHYEFTGNVQIEKQPLCPKFVTDCPSDARLRFLADLIVESGIPFSQFLKKIDNMYYSTMQSFFERDNIRISNLCKIAECMDTKIVWELNEE